VSKKTIGRIGFSSVFVLTLSAYACSSGDTGAADGELSGGTSSGATGATGGLPTVTGGTGGDTGATAGTGGTETAGTGGTGGGLGAGGSIFIDPNMAGTGGTMDLTPDAACGTGEASAMLKKVSMLIMFDRSWSMTQCSDPALTPPGFGDSLACTDGVTPSRWDLTSQALTLFFQDAAAADLNVALRFFPDDAPGCTGFDNQSAGTDPNCDANVCAVPLVDLGTLTADAAPVDTHEGNLVAAVAASLPPGPAIPNPNPATPTFAALSGASIWATAYQTAHPEEQAVIVLVTDGEPFGCETNANNIAQIAADAYTTAGVLTYAVGLTGSSEQQLNQIASSGGTDQAFFVSDGSTATQDLLNALIAIKGMALACDFPVPTATSSGMDIDPHLINVNYTSGGMEIELGLVGSEAECGAQQAWYYDDPTSPTRIILCPGTCSSITSDITAEIEILAGCEPRIPITT
jgi:hypothetical protein